MRLAFLLTYLFSFVFFLSTDGQEKISDNLSKKITEDIASIENILNDVKGYENVGSLKMLVDKYKPYTSSENGDLTHSEKLYNHYIILARESFKHIPKTGFSNLKDRLDELKEKYYKVESLKDYKKLHRILIQLKKEYKKDKVSFVEVVKEVAKAKNVDIGTIDIADIFRETGGALIELDRLLDDFGRYNEFSSSAMDSLRRNPIHHINSTTEINNKENKILNRRKTKLDSINRTLQAVNDTISQQTKKLQLANDELVKGNEQLISKIKLTEKALQDARQKENEWLTKLTAYEKNIEEKKQIIQERESALLAIVNKESELKIASYMLEDTLAELSRQAIVATNTTAKMKADIETLKIEKAYVQAKQIKTEWWRTVFLGSSAFLLFGLLIGAIYDRSRVRRRNMQFIAERDKLIKSLEHVKEVYGESYRVDEVKAAAKNLHTEQQIEEYAQLSDLYLIIQKNSVRRIKQLQDTSKELEDITQLQEATLKELKHRTRGNLQKLISILEIREFVVNNVTEEERTLTRDFKRRIAAFGCTIKELYRYDFSTDEIISFDIKAYIKEITSYLKKNFKYEDELDINMDTDMEKISINVEIAASLGLLISELITNILKHAFTNHTEPKIDIQFTHNKPETQAKNRDKDLLLIIQDNGNTVDENGHCIRKDPLAKIIIDSCIEDLKGTFKYKIKNEGIRHVIKFPQSSR